MKTYEEMAHSALNRIDEYETSKKQSRGRAIKAAAPVLTLCLVAMLGFGVWNGGLNDRTDNMKQNNTTNSIMQAPNNVTEPQDVIPMISSYGIAGDASYAAPKNGEVFKSIPLSGALEEYDDSARYQVIVYVFKDGVQLDSNSAEVQAELERLGALGYTTVFEEHNNGEDTEYVFSLHATKEELQSFSCNEKYGYFFFLYGEFYSSSDTSSVTNYVHDGYIMLA